MEAAVHCLKFPWEIVLLTNPAAADLSIWMGDFGWVRLISSSVFFIADISWDAIKSAPSSASEAEDKANVII